LKGHHRCIELLIDHGADKSPRDVRHCVPPLSRARSLNILPASHTQCLSLSLVVLISPISQPSEARQDTRTSRQDARDCSIDSRSRCVPLSLMLALSLNLSRCGGRSID